MSQTVESPLEAALAAMEPAIGAEIGVSDWLVVDQAMIDRFADAIMDHQFIHVDPERAAETPLGGTVAHGFLTLSLASRLAMDGLDPVPGQAMGLNYGLDRVRFVSPVRSGSRVRGRFELVATERRSPVRLLRTLGLTVEIEGETTPALVARWLTMAVFPEEG